MARVPLKALSLDDETVLEDAMIELNELAETEPRFFTRNFKDLFDMFLPIIAKNDYNKPSIRH